MNNKSRKKKSAKSTSAVSHPAIAPETYNKAIDIREKRIGIVFKIIYVTAVFIAAAIAISSTEPRGTLTAPYMLSMGLFAFLAQLIYYLIAYVFNELKCFKISESELSPNQVSKTEHSYTAIFSYVPLGAITAFLTTIVAIALRKFLTVSILTYIAIPGLFLANGILYGLLKKSVFKTVLVTIINTISLCALFFALQY